VLAVLAIFAATPPAAADYISWTGAGSTNRWSRADNWEFGAAPQAGDVLRFNTRGDDRYTTIVNDRTLANSLYQAINFESTSAAYTINGNTLRLASGGLSNASSNLQTVNTAITLSSAQTWYGGAAGMNVNGLVSGGALNTALTLESKVAVNNASAAFVVGSEVDATLNLLSGSTLASASGRIGGESGASHVTVSGGGSKWTTTGSFQIGAFNGYPQGSTLSVLDGGQMRTGDAIVGASPAGRSSAAINGAASGWSAAGLSLAQGGDGLLEVQAGGSLTTTSASTLGVSAGRTGTLNLDGTGSSWNAAAVNVGSGGAGVLNIGSGAQLVSTGAVQVNASGTLNLSSGSILKATALQLSGGTVNVYDGFAWSNLASVNIGANSTLGGSVTGGAGRTISAGAGAVLGSLDAARGYAFEGLLQVQGNGVTLRDAHAVELGALTTMAGGSSLASSNGILLGSGHVLSYTGSASIAGAFTNDGHVAGADNSSLLAFQNDVDGDGSFAGNVAFAAAYGPGHSPASVSFGQGDVSFTADATLTMEAFGVGAGEFDQLLDIDDLNFLGHLSLVFGPGFSASGGANLHLFDFNHLSYAFDVARISVSGLDRSRLDFSRLGVDGSLGILADLGEGTVPEPGSWALSLLALGLAARARKGRRLAA
jgi:T5SS/PEP-CTERM-associated repeat protein